MPATVVNYATSVSDWPHGAVNQLTLGNGVVETTAYSNRLQVDSITAAKTSELWKLQNFYCSAEGPSFGSNNRNVVSQKVTVNGGALVVATKYGYDTVDRLTLAEEHSASLSGQIAWTQNYGYCGRQQQQRPVWESAGDGGVR